MGAVSRTVVSLRVFGEAVIPAEVTALLGCKPSFSYAKGDLRPSRAGRDASYYQSGMWKIEAAEAEPEAIDAQVQETLARLTPDLQIWKKLAQNHRIDLFCGLFMDEVNEGIELSPETLVQIGQRGISLGFDIYGPADDDD